MLQEQTQAFTVSYYPAGARPPADLDILENRWLHQVFVLTHKLAFWPAWGLGAGLLLLAAVAWLAWRPVGAGPAFAAAGLYLAFSLADWLLLAWLPRARRSFGPVGPQLLVMTTPRLGVALLAAIPALVWAGRPGAAGLLLALVALLQLAGLAVYLWGMLHQPFALGLSRVAIAPPGLPAGAPALRLLHLSDLHVERLTGREDRLLELVEQARPDLIVITGDYLNLSYVNEPTARAEVRRVLARLRAPYGVYATLGSPPVDPPETTPSLFDGLDIRLLRDEVAVIRLADGRTVSLLGLDCSHDLEVDGQMFRRLVQIAPAGSARILLYHSPELMPQVREHPVDLYLCGHTHGGQVRLPLLGALLTSSALGKQYEMGPYREQGTLLYISRGIGLEGLSAPRMRLFCPPEIILFTLNGKA